jgi:Protein of unknown function (DUF2634).
MAETLFPVVQTPEFTEEGTDYDRKYKRSMKWDVAKGDFVRDGANRVVECDGREAFAVWCFKIAQTERYRCLAYSASIGVEMEMATQEDDEKTVESMVQRTITDALMVNPRTEWVRNFEFQHNADELHCSFLVKGIEWDNLITITI